MKIFKSKKTTAKNEQSIVPLNKTELQNVVGGTDGLGDATTNSEIVEGKKGLNAVNVRLS